MKILFISYYFEPFDGVGAKRVSYWAKYIHEYGIQSTVITATEQTKIDEHIIYLAPSQKKRFISNFIKDEGLNWMTSLKSYFLEHEKAFDYDVVLISGGPFMHFEIGGFLKNKFKTKIVLDFRDPFANNPRFNENFIKKNIKKFFEKKYIYYSDKVITVNNLCKNLIINNSKTEIIPNGFDENVLNYALSKLDLLFEKGKIVNGGKLYADFNIKPIINVVVSSNNLFFKQIGFKLPKSEEDKSNRISSCAFLEYELLVDEIIKAEICTVFTGGKEFETPTKTFDYIGLNKKILVITEKKINNGGIYNITKNYPNVIWSQNNEKEIEKAIHQLQKMEIKPFDSYKYSRAYGLKKLVEILKKL